MQRIPVQSSDLRAVGYDVLSLVLEIEFHSGGIYQYYRVPIEIVDELLGADSLGRYFARQIKNNKKYPCYQVYPKKRWLRR